MPVVSDTLLKSDGTADTTARVVIRLSGADPAIGWVTSADSSLVTSATVRPDSAGLWTATLTANSLITPSNTAYRVDVHPTDGPVVTYYISVPASTGPYHAGDILTTAPTSTSLTVHASTHDPNSTDPLDFSDMPVERVYNVKTYGATGDGTTDDTTAIRAAITAAYNSGGYNKVYLPSGTYKITSTLAIPANIDFVGAGSRPGTQGGTDIQWAGGNSNWIECGTTGVDWSDSSIQDLRITKHSSVSPTSGYALVVYNPTNTAKVKGINAFSAPDGQIYITGALVGANFFALEDFFVAGGLYPLRITGGRQTVHVRYGGIDLGSTSLAGMLIESGESQAMTTVVESVKVEGSYDVPGFKVTSIAPVTFIACTRYNLGGSGTQPGFTFTNSGQEDAQVALINCTVLGTTPLFSAPGRTATIPGHASTGRLASFVMPTRYFYLYPYNLSNAQGRQAYLHYQAQFAWTDSTGDPDAWDVNLYRSAANVLATDDAFQLGELSATPSSPASGTQAQLYLKGDKLIIAFNDAGTVRYKYLDLTGTGVTWVHTTTAP